MSIEPQLHHFFLCLSRVFGLPPSNVFDDGDVDVLVFFLFSIGINLSTSRHTKKYYVGHWIDDLCAYSLLFFRWFGLCLTMRASSPIERMYIEKKIFVFSKNHNLLPELYFYTTSFCVLLFGMRFELFSNSATVHTHRDRVWSDDQMRFEWNRKKVKQENKKKNQMFVEMIMGQQLADNCNKMPLKMPFEREKKTQFSFMVICRFPAKIYCNRLGYWVQNSRRFIQHRKWIFIHVGIASFFPVNLEQINDNRRLSSL